MVYAYITNSMYVYPLRKSPFFPFLKSKIGTPNLTIACDNKLFVCDVAFSYSNMKSIIDLIDYFLWLEVFTCDSLH